MSQDLSQGLIVYFFCLLTVIVYCILDFFTFNLSTVGIRIDFGLIPFSSSGHLH